MNKFSIDLTRIVNKYKGRIDDVVQRVTYDMFYDIIYMSPVDKGFFKGAWVASEGDYSRIKIENIDKQGDATVAKMAAVVNSTPAGSVVYLVNNMPYSIRLEYGYSNQTPAGMIRVTANRFQDYYANVAAKVK